MAKADIPGFETLLIANLQRFPSGVKYFLATAWLVGWLSDRPFDWPAVPATCWREFEAYWEEISHTRPGPLPLLWDGCVSAGWRRARRQGGVE